MKPLVPARTWQALVPPGAVLSLRLGVDEARLLRFDDDLIDRASGYAAGWAGAMPVFRHEATQSPAALRLFEQAGMPAGPTCDTYRHAQEAIEWMQSAAGQGAPIACLYPPDSAWGVDDALVVPRALVAHLNCKSSLPLLVPNHALPPARVVRADSLSDIASLDLDPPLYVKAHAKSAHGFGVTVRRAESRTQARAAAEALCNEFPEMEEFRIEAAIEVQRTWCMNFAIGDPGVTYVGSAEQRFNASGTQVDSGIDAAHPLPDAARALGLGIAREGQRQGYRGFAGFDIGLDRNGKCVVFDANFRGCFSTALVLWFPSAADRVGATCAETFQIEAPHSLAQLHKRVASAIRAGWLIPTQVFDGSTFDEPRASRLRGMVLGATQAEAAARRAEVRALLGAHD